VRLGDPTDDLRRRDRARIERPWVVRRALGDADQIGALGLGLQVNIVQNQGLERLEVAPDQAHTGAAAGSVA